MSYVIAAGCCNDAACVAVCPVDAIHPRPEDPAFLTAEQLYIDPQTCIDCSACMFTCPVSAIHDGFELPGHLAEFAEINAEYFFPAPPNPGYLTIEPARVVSQTPCRIAVIGAGPAACYAIAEICRTCDVTIDVFERLPTPFGLARSGVAPDHPSTKQISAVFQSALEHPDVNCYFNIEVGTDVSLEELRRSHHAVIYAAGAHDDRALGIEGEALRGSHSARELVGWYNTHPDFVNAPYDFSTTCAVIIGNGNVAMDVARILVSPTDILQTTDMSEQAIDALRNSAIETIVIAARRGPGNAACTTSELLALQQVPGIEVTAIPDEVRAWSADEPTTNPVELRKRKFFSDLADARLPKRPGVKRIVFRFGLNPLTIRGDQRVDGVKFEGARGDATEIIDCGLVIRATGYRISPFPGIPFDESKNSITHRSGRVVADGSGRIDRGLYCVGWAKRGPTGVIGTNKECSLETVAALIEDLGDERLPQPNLSMAALDSTIRARNPDVVDLEGWNRIDVEEQRRGHTSQPLRPRLKLPTVQEMLRYANPVQGTSLQAAAR